jgi:acyl carrier protein|tara:strand:- start:200 stop:448 length:249 start_codon:yes stop_codon:yes gene_type:complete
MKKKELLSIIKKIFLSKRLIKKNIKKKDLINFNIFENEKIDSLMLMTIIAELENISKKNINLGYFKIKKNQTVEKIINKIYK